MAPVQQPRKSVTKLAKLPAGASIKKRPLFRPAIPSPYSNETNPKVVYIKHSTPFMSAVRRVRNLLKQVDKRAAQSVTDTSSAGGDRILNAAKHGIAHSKKEAVTIKGSGRAIEKVLDLGAWFGQRQVEEGVVVRLATSSATAIDDVEYDDDDDTNQQHDDLPDARLRRTSVLEVRISLR